MIARSRKALLPGERIRVLVVDDSVVIRRLVTHALERDAELEVVGVAANGAIALKQMRLLNPDVVTLDIEMPELDGLATLRRLHREYPQVRVIMFSTLTERGASATFEALSLGADDYVTKASNAGSLEDSLARLEGELVPKIKQFFRIASYSRADMAKDVSAIPAGTARVAPQVVVIGSSTGGPSALAAVLPQFPAGFRLPVLVVQHMPPLFTRLLAERLHASCPLAVEEAKQGAAVAAGKIFIAPGDFHLKVGNDGDGVHVVLDQSPQQNFCRPAADALFASVAQVYGGAVLALVLTGMGRDGLRGAEMLRAQGAEILVQDEDTSVVWGMPGAVANAGLADRVLPLDRCATEILRRVEAVQG